MNLVCPFEFVYENLGYHRDLQIKRHLKMTVNLIELSVDLAYETTSLCMPWVAGAALLQVEKTSSSTSRLWK